MKISFKHYETDAHEAITLTHAIYVVLRQLSHCPSTNLSEEYYTDVQCMQPLYNDNDNKNQQITQNTNNERETLGTGMTFVTSKSARIRTTFHTHKHTQI